MGQSGGVEHRQAIDPAGPGGGNVEEQRMWRTLRNRSGWRIENIVASSDVTMEPS